MSETDDILREVEAIARQAGDMALRLFGRATPDVKADESYVTVADRNVEEFIRRELSTRFPDDAIIGEEYGDAQDGESDYTWAIDPIDGTTNFVAGLPHWCVCIARLRAGRPELGVVSAPVLDEVYTGVRGHGAALNGRSLRIPDRTHPENEQLLAVWSTAFREIRIDFSGKLRTLGSTAMKCLYLARGSYIGALTPEVHVWDVAAGLPVLWEAGGESRLVDGTVYEVMDLDPAHGFAVPPLVLTQSGSYSRVRKLFRPLS